MAKPKKRTRKLRDQNLEVMRKMKCNKVNSKKKYKRKPKHDPLTGDAFEFVSVSLAAASGRLSMDAWAAYLGAFHP